MYKDFIKFRKYARTQNINVNEQYLLELLFEYHNTEFGYCFLSIDAIMKAFNTKANKRVINTIKSLEKKGLLIVDRSHRKNNKYYIVDIENFITTADKKEDAPMNEVEEVDPVKEDERILLAKKTITVGKISKKLKKLLLSTDTEIIKTAIENIKNKSMVTANYLYNAINLVSDKVKTTAVKCGNNASESVKGFCNFTGREYTAEYYADLEAKLLGWA